MLFGHLSPVERSASNPTTVLWCSERAVFPVRAGGARVAEGAALDEEVRRAAPVARDDAGAAARLVGGRAVGEFELAVAHRDVRRLDREHRRLPGARLGEVEGEARGGGAGAGEDEKALPARALHFGVRVEHGARAAPADEAERGLREARAVGVRGEDVGAPLAAEDADLVAVRGGGRRRVERGEGRFRRRPVAFRGLVGEAVDVEDGGMRGHGDEQTRGDREEPVAVPPEGNERAFDESRAPFGCHGLQTVGTTAKKTSGSMPSLTSVCSWPSGQKWQSPGARISGTPSHVAVPRPERT